MLRLLTVFTTVVREVYVFASVAIDAEESIDIVLAFSVVVTNWIFICFKKCLTLVDFCSKENDGVYTLAALQQDMREGKSLGKKP